MAAATREVEAADAALALVEARHEQGRALLVELLDAQLVLTQSEAQSAIAQRDQAVALVNLERSAGVLGETEND